MECPRCKKQTFLYVLTWRDPDSANRNVYKTINKDWRYCPLCAIPINRTKNYGDNKND